MECRAGGGGILTRNPRSNDAMAQANFYTEGTSCQDLDFPQENGNGPS